MKIFFGIILSFLVLPASLSHAAGAGATPNALHIYYMEEQPMEYTLEVTIDAGKDASIDISTLKPDCPESWERACWTKSTRHVRLAYEERQKLAELLAADGLASIPREVAVPPAGGRVRLVANIEGGRKIDILASLRRAGDNPEFRELRRVILAVAGI